MFGKRLRLFRLHGSRPLEVKVDASWVFFACFLAWSLTSAFFPIHYPGLRTNTYAWLGLVGTLGFFLSVLAREMSHMLFARRSGAQPRSATLFLFGSFPEEEGRKETPQIELQSSAMGILTSVLVGIVSVLALWLGRNAGWARPIDATVSFLAVTNLLLAALHLLPVLPMDGGKMLHASLWLWKGDKRKTTRVLSQTAVPFVLSLIGIGIFQFFKGETLSGVWIALIGLSLGGAAKICFDGSKKGNQTSLAIGSLMTHDPVTVPPHLNLQDFVEQFLHQYDYKFFPVVEGKNLLGCVEMKYLRAIPRDEWADHTVRDLVRPCSHRNVVLPGTDVHYALKLMSETGNSRMLVAEGNHLLGVLSLRDILRNPSLRHSIPSKAA
jgi:Zn-dependent protease/predicted transcriptional regulator